MSDISPDQQAVLTRRINRLHILTIVSLSLNGLILVLFLLGAILHHHHRHHHGFGGGDGRGCGCFGRFEGRGGDEFHHHFMHGEWGGGGGGEDFHHGCGGGGFGGDKFGGGRPDDRADFGLGHPQDGMGGGGFGSGQMGHGGFAGGGMGMGMGGPGAPPDPAKMTDMVLAHLSQQLTLTDDQKAKIKPIITAGVTDLQKQFEELHAAMQKETRDARAKIRPILTADQQKQFDAMHLPGDKPADKPTF